MKIIFRQYLASLRERGELDAVLPDLLSQLGYTVISRPAIGTRQYGVDVAAIGPAGEGRKQKLYLFSIKQGDLTRTDWDDGSPQALRPSINEIVDVYIPTRIAKAHQKYEIVICLCFGGEVHQAVRDNVTQFTNQLTRDGLSFEEWNGDRLAGLLVQGVLREQLVDKALRTSFRKAVAMVDEPEIAFLHFSKLIEGLCTGAHATSKQRITALRQLNICLWVLFVWARDAGNLEAPFRASERALLYGWHLVHADIARGGKSGEEVGAAYFELSNLHTIIWDALIGEKILPFVGTKHAISEAVNSASSLDVNLKLFETLGRISLHGLNLLWTMNSDAHVPTARSHWGLVEAQVDSIAHSIVSLIKSNPILRAPVADHQAVDIAVTLIFLSMMDKWQPAAKSYVEAMINRVVFAYMTRSRYPTTHGDYRSLIEHCSNRSDEHREAHTKGSTLFPLLSLWASSLGADKSAGYLAEFSEKQLPHCHMQLWFPGPDTEEKLYTGGIRHGLSFGNIPITTDGESAIGMLEAECKATSHFAQLSAIRLGHWTNVALACRHYRLPIPPNLWLALLKQLRAKHMRPSESPPSRAPKRRSRRPVASTP